MQPLDIKGLCDAAVQALLAGQNVTLGLPAGWVKPKGWPRGELLSVNPHNHVRNYSHDPLRVLAWVQRAVKQRAQGGPR